MWMFGVQKKDSVSPFGEVLYGNKLLYYLKSVKTKLCACMYWKIVDGACKFMKSKTGEALKTVLDQVSEEDSHANVVDNEDNSNNSDEEEEGTLSKEQCVPAVNIVITNGPQ